MSEDIKKFETLEERMLFYRSKPEQVIPKNSYVLCMLDGKNFSSLVKEKFLQPFDNQFITLMNDTAAYVCSKIQGSKFAFVQSDEISIFISDAEAEDRTLYFKGRMVKMLSVIPAIATSYFNRRIIVVYIKLLTHLEQEEILESIRSAIESFVRNENIDVNKDLEQMIMSTNCFDHYWIGDTLTIQL